MTTMIATIDRSATESDLTFWLNRIRAEYREMPGLSLTQAQMQRLWDVDVDTCDTLIDSLLAARILRRTATGHFIAYET